MRSRVARGIRNAVVSWIAKGGARGPVIFVDEFERRGRAWHGSPTGRPPGCGIPDAAAAAWQLDVSQCRRPDAPGDSS